MSFIKIKDKEKSDNMFVIGNVADSGKLDNISKEVTYGGGGYKLYGVRFPFVKEDDSIEPYKGERLYNAIGLNITPNYADHTGLDDFINLENGKSPFGIKECATKYNPSTGRQEIMTYKGESDWESAISDPTHNRMIEFPKFYYKRPSETEWVVSKDPFPGSSPSPMHYRNGVLYDKWYVSKYVLGTVIDGTGDEDIKSQSNSQSEMVTVIYDSIGNYPKYRRILRDEGMCLLDYASYCTISMLMIIKYGTTNLYSIYGYGGNSNAIGIMDNFGFEGNSLSINDVPTYCDSVIMGLERFFNNLYTTFVDGIYNLDYDIYINTDIENISLENPSADNNTGFIKANNNSLRSNGRFELSTEFPFAIYVTEATSGENTKYTYNEYATNRYLLSNTGGSYSLLHVGYDNLLSYVFVGNNAPHFRSQCHL